ncbi:7-carboxy-7-deazaguanine synthase QueE [Bradyrhizobium manausense]|uniref:7-carboxy-7-deazaguanine synthase n=1 Tax=Bradyrhizobium manausense TaxID=989370 RepID=A0A0R3D215_9BRAD|nr:7-carboxy-7-deazaguanine synthase QueE [Bradyrhizobium manausense]KRQ03851.1 pyrroloquinoline quinone biosynthesis protein [Bradyrhizobium manausense]
MLPVNEIFETIQGEACKSGTPSVFLRLQACPVRCPWCDSKHTWVADPANQVSIAEITAKVEDTNTWAMMSPREILLAVQGFRARHVVITGGEPAAYDLQPLTTLLIKSGFSVQVETSGTHAIQVHPCTWVTISPKIGMPGGLVVLDEALRRGNEIKHCVGKPADIEKLLALNIPREFMPMIWLQPLSQSRKATKLCIQEATARDWRVSIQTHKFLGVR